MNQILSINKIITFVFTLIIFSFFFVSQVSAASITYTRGFFDNGYTGPTTPCSNSSGCDQITQCWNSEAPGVTNCGTACYGGTAWTQYTVACYQTYLDPFNGAETCQSTYMYAAKTCSTADKYNSSNPSVMSAGMCNCSNGGGYKTCCSGTNPVAAVTTNIDPYPPPEAYCPSGSTTLFCGFGGYPSCGQPTCDALTPPPSPTPPPASPTPPPSCTQTNSYPQCGATCNGITYPNNDTVQVTVYSCTDGTTQYNCSDLGPIQGQCGNGSSCPSMTCRYSQVVDTGTCSSGIQWVSGTGCSGDNCAGCTYVGGNPPCSTLSCYTPTGTPPPTPPPPPPPSQHCYECKSSSCAENAPTFFIDSWEYDSSAPTPGQGACTNSMGSSCNNIAPPGSGNGSMGCWPQSAAVRAQQIRDNAQSGTGPYADGSWYPCGAYWNMDGNDKDIGFCRQANIQGSKVLLPTYTTAPAINSQTVSLTDVWGNPGGTDTNNPYLFYGVPPIIGKTYRVSVPLLAGYNISYSLCYNRTNCHNPAQAGYQIGEVGTGNSVTIVDSKIGLNRGYVDLWWQYTPQPGTVQGEKVMMPGLNMADPANSQVIFYDSRPSTANNPYSITNIPPGSHTFSVSIPSGYAVGYTLCTGAPATWAACHNSTPTPGSTATFNVTSGMVADLYWHFTKTISPWIQATGDVHSNSRINAPGGP